MRVLQLNTVSGISSTGRIATDIAQLLKSKGNECSIIYGIGQNPKALQQFSYKIGNNIGVKTHSAISQLFDAEGYASQSATRQAIQHTKSFNPDIIHMHNIHGCYLNISLWFDFLKSFNKPVVWTMHDCWLFTGHCAYFDFVNCNKWQSLCKACPQSKNSYPRNMFCDFSTRNFKHKAKAFQGLNKAVLVSPSKWLENLVKQSFLKQYPTRLIYNGVNLSNFKACDASAFKQEHNLQNKRVLLSIANDWDRRKGLIYLLDLSRLLPSDYMLVVIGLSLEQCNNLPENVLGVQKTNSISELVQWYNLADVLVNPTLEDNMPLVNLEALACGLPVAVFNTGGCPEVINNSVGAVVNKGDVQAMKNAILKIAPNKAMYTQACIKKAQEFNQNSCYENYIKLYEELCQ